MSTDGLTPGGQRLALHYARTLGLVAQVAQAAESGDYPALSDFAGALSTAADELAAAASFVTTEGSATSPRGLLLAVHRLVSPEE
ncbi:hypothetical protein [Streptacidiphilus sp. EB129]|uniref:hypothetical protein n=1 Tax=Streptacidiphilus sp. EB129 TaxID=3156262 RepID=UPI0035168A0C